MMNAKTEKRLGLMAAFLLTAAIFIAPNAIAQHHQLHSATLMNYFARSIPQPVMLAQNYEIIEANH